MSEEKQGRQYANKKPCGSCPFARSTPGDKSVEKVNPLVLIGQAQGPFLLPCHQDPEYLGAHRVDNLKEISQCAGAAIYRANLGIAERLPAALHALAANTELVFASPEELLAHFAGATVEEAKQFLANCGGADELLRKALHDAGNKGFLTPAGSRLS